MCLPLLHHCASLPVLGVCLGHQALAAAHGATVGRAPTPIHGRLSPVRHSGHALFSGIPSGAGYQVTRYHSLAVDPATLPPCLEATAWTDDAESVIMGLAHKERPHVGEERRLLLLPCSSKQTLDCCVCVRTDSRPSLRSRRVRILRCPGGPQRVCTHSGSALSLFCSLPLLLPIVATGVQFHPESIATQFGKELVANFFRIAAAHWCGARGRCVSFPLSIVSF